MTTKEPQPVHASRETSGASIPKSTRKGMATAGNGTERLVVRYEHWDDIHQAFLSLSCPLIRWNFVQPGGFC